MNQVLDFLKGYLEGVSIGLAVLIFVLLMREGWKQLRQLGDKV